jgi:hypothetical protein
MRPVRFARGLMIDICYICERESDAEDEDTVLKRLVERALKDDTEK